MTYTIAAPELIIFTLIGFIAGYLARKYTLDQRLKEQSIEFEKNKKITKEYIRETKVQMQETREMTQTILKKWEIAQKDVDDLKANYALHQQEQSNSRKQVTQS